MSSRSPVPLLPEVFEETRCLGVGRTLELWRLDAANWTNQLIRCSYSLSSAWAMVPWEGSTLGLISDHRMELPTWGAECNTHREIPNPIRQTKPSKIRRAEANWEQVSPARARLIREVRVTLYSFMFQYSVTEGRRVCDFILYVTTALHLCSWCYMQRGSSNRAQVMANDSPRLDLWYAMKAPGNIIIRTNTWVMDDLIISQLCPD